MSTVMTSRGRILSSQQVRFSEAPVRLSAHVHSLHSEPSVSVKTDPDTGDVIEISVRCTCGEVIVVACNYAGTAEDSAESPGAAHSQRELEP